MDDKVYTNQEIADTPFPNQPDNTTVTDSTPSSSNTKAAGQTTIPQQSFIQKNIAVETESQALNTRTKKIIQEFQFTPSGAIQIGDFESGVSGDLRISPNGIAARNNLGDETFAIDADTGDAVFKGIVLAGDFQVIDDQGLISLSAFTTDSVTVLNPADISSTSYVDVVGATLSFSLQRHANLLILLNVQALANLLSQGDKVAGRYTLSIDGNTVNTISVLFNDCEIYTPSLSEQLTRTFNLSGQQTVVLGPGNHTLKIVARMTPSNPGSQVLITNSATLTYIILGR